MNFVDEEHVARLERGENAGQVARFVEHGPAGYFKAHAQLVGNDVRKCRLAQSRRAVQQGVVERFATVFGSFYEHLEVFHNLLLPAEVAEAKRPEGVFEVFLAAAQAFFSDVKVFVHDELFACKDSK